MFSSTTSLALKYIGDFTGDGVADNFLINHALNSELTNVEVWLVDLLLGTPIEIVDTATGYIDDDNINICFYSPPSVTQRFKVLVLA